jgi:hypothetical protein
MMPIWFVLFALTLDLTKSSNIVSTSECDKIRTTPFVAKLELEYLYLVESIVPLQDLRGMQNVNNRAILDALTRCDNQSTPEFALDLAVNHNDVEQGMIFSILHCIFSIANYEFPFPTRILYSTKQE